MSPPEGIPFGASRNRHRASAEVKFVGCCANIDFDAIRAAVGRKRTGLAPSQPFRPLFACASRGRVGCDIAIVGRVQRRRREAPRAGAARGRGPILDPLDAPHGHGGVRHRRSRERDKISFELTVALLMTGAAGGLLVAVAVAVAVGTVTSSALDFTLVPAAVVSVAVNAYGPAAKTAVVKLQTKELLEVAVPSEFAPPSRHRYDGAGRCCSSQGNGMVGIDHAIGDSWSRGWVASGGYGRDFDRHFRRVSACACRRRVGCGIAIVGCT